MDKKNTLLLTVIAVATLLVAVVGATFAYFTAQGGTSASKNVTVQTETANSASFNVTEAIAITADQETFAQGKGNRTGSTTGSASFTAASNADGDFCYEVALSVTANSFQYSSTNTAHDAELTLTASKGVGEAAKTTLFNAKDITTLAPAEGESSITLKVPNTLDGTDYVHKIHATKGTTVTDNWDLTVTLVNLDVDQNDNAGDAFTGTLTFSKVACPTTGD